MKKVSNAVLLLVLVVLGLFLMVNAELREPLRPLPERRLNVLDFGAMGSGNTKDTEAVVSAIAELERLGGGYVFFPPGQYLVGAFNLSSNIGLDLSEGALLLGSNDIEDYPVIPALPSYGEGRDVVGPGYSALISGFNVTNVAIVGSGTIDAQGEFWWNLKAANQVRHSRPHVIEFLWSQNIEISDINIWNSPFWTVHPVYCDNVLIENVTIINPKDAPNTDGIDIDSTSNVLITGCTISVGDDMICVKSGLDIWGREVNIPSVNVTAVYNTLGDGKGLTIGSETSGGIANVLFAFNTFKNSERMIRIKTGNTRGGYIKDVLYLNNTGVGIFEFPISVDLNYKRGGSGRYLHQVTPPQISNIVVRNVVSLKSRKVGEILGAKDFPVDFLTLENVYVPHALKPWVCSKAQVSSSNVQPAIPTSC